MRVCRIFGWRASQVQLCNWTCPAHSGVAQLRKSIPGCVERWIARCAQDNEALLVLAQLDDRSLQDLGIVRTAYMRAASNLPSTE
jgi:uncharacterized protein YjiS (DUF1127 family)